MISKITHFLSYINLKVVCCSSLTSTSTSTLPKSNSSTALRLTDLIAKHVQSILGQDFWNDSLTELAVSKTKHYMLLEMVITVWFISIYNIIIVYPLLFYCRFRYITYEVIT